MCAIQPLRLCSKMVLALLLVGCTAQLVVAQMVIVPGTLYDQNKYFRGDMPDHIGGNSGWFDDYDGDGLYDPGEPYGDSNPGGWTCKPDLSCWAATAANMLRYVGGADKYNAWVYVDGVVHRDLNEDKTDYVFNTHYWDWGGFTDVALEREGHFCSADYENNMLFDNPTVLESLWAANINMGMPVGLAYKWFESSGTNSGAHAITLYGINVLNKTMLIADSDDANNKSTDVNIRQISYAIGPNYIQLNPGTSANEWIYGYTTLEQTEWTGSGTSGSSYTSGPTTLWSDSMNWTGYWETNTKWHMLDPTLLRIYFENSGKLLMDCSHEALKIMLEGSNTHIEFNSAGNLNTQILQNRNATIDLPAGHLNVAQDFLHGGILNLSGSGSLTGNKLSMGAPFVGSGSIYQSGGSANFTTVVMGDSLGANSSQLGVTGGTFHATTFQLGRTSQGELMVSFPGHVTVSSLMEMGSLSGGVGLAYVSGGYLTVSKLVVGAGGEGNLDVSDGGRLTVQNAFEVGQLAGSKGEVWLTNGSFATASLPLKIGVAGQGTFNQSGSSIFSPAKVVVGAESGGVGLYNMSVGSLDTETITIGAKTGADGQFIQSDGWVDVSDEVCLADEFNTVRASYELNNGTLTTDQLSVGFAGSGMYKQTGGVLNVNEITLGALQSSSGWAVLSGSGKINAHTILVANNGSGEFDMKGGTIEAQDEIVGFPCSGKFIQTGGMNHVTNTLRMAALGSHQSTYTISDGALRVDQQILLDGDHTCFQLFGGEVTTDVFNISPGGQIQSSHNGTLRVNKLTGLPANFSLAGNLIFGHSGGTTSAAYSVGAGQSLGVNHTMTVGENANATFQQLGGNVHVGELVIGNYAPANATYAINASGSNSLIVDEDEFVGCYGQALLNQSYGTHDVGGTIHVGYNEGGKGTFALNGGTLTAEKLTLGEAAGASGIFTQNNGTATLNTELRLGAISNTSAGSYKLNGGELHVPGVEYIGDQGAGVFEQTGGLHQCSQWMMLGYNGGSEGQYKISGGELRTGTLWVGYNGDGKLELSGSGVVAVEELIKSSSGTVSTSWGTLRVNKLTGFGLTPSFTCDLKIGHSGGTMKGSYYLVSGMSLNTNNLTVGYDALGSFSQSGGVNTVTNAFWLGEKAGAIATYGLGGAGALAATYEYIGGYGMGTFNQNGGGNSVNATMQVGANGLYNLEAGSLNVGGLLVGDGGQVNWNGGIFTANSVELRTGGTLSVPHDWLFPGILQVEGGTLDMTYCTLALEKADSAAPSEMTGGEVKADSAFIGSMKYGQLTQSGGGFNLADTLTLGAGPAATGKYTLSNGNLSATDEDVAYQGTGDFVHTSGVNRVYGELSIGRMTDSHGTYSLSAIPGATAPTLYATTVRIGQNGTGIVTQSAGLVQINDSLTLGGGPTGYGKYIMTDGTLHVGGTVSVGQSPGSNAELSVQGGSFTAAGVIVGGVGSMVAAPGQGTWKIGSAPMITVSQFVKLNAGAWLNIPAPAVIHLTGSQWINECSNAQAMADMANLTLVFEGGNQAVDPFEVAGKDLGAVMEGFYDNFALGTLQLGGDAGIGQIKLVDLFDNQQDGMENEVLYVHNLVLNHDSFLDLNGFDLYYNSFTNLGGTIVLNGGNLIFTAPEPSTLVLLGLGVIGFLTWASRRRR
jgi:hypothetical protein